MVTAKMKRMAFCFVLSIKFLQSSMFQLCVYVEEVVFI